MGARPVAVKTEIGVDAGGWPDEPELYALAERALDTAYATAAADGAPPRDDYEVSVVFTDDIAVQALNLQWRGKNQPTNVLSFPQSGPAPQMLGDIVLGYETVAREAALEHKPIEHHIAHLIVHGFLHLVGYDHQDTEDAEHMEQLERIGLAEIGIADPYAAIAVNDG
jgi:probable rRNA maturation factor